MLGVQLPPSEVEHYADGKALPWRRGCARPYSGRPRLQGSQRARPPSDLLPIRVSTVSLVKAPYVYRPVCSIHVSVLACLPSEVPDRVGGGAIDPRHSAWIKPTA